MKLCFFYINIFVTNTTAFQKIRLQKLQSWWHISPTLHHVEQNLTKFNKILENIKKELCQQYLGLHFQEIILKTRITIASIMAVFFCFKNTERRISRVARPNENRHVGRPKELSDNKNWRKFTANLIATWGNNGGINKIMK